MKNSIYRVQLVDEKINFTPIQVFDKNFIKWTENLQKVFQYY